MIRRRGRPGVLRTVALLVTVTLLLTAGCSPSHDVPLYNLWAVNTSAESRVIVLGVDPEGTTVRPALLIPADGMTRSTYGATIGSQAGATASILVYDSGCTLITKVEVRVGSYLLTLRGEEAILSELARSTEPTGAALAADAPVNCAV